MSTDQKLDLLLSEIAELKAMLYGQKTHSSKKQSKKETKEEITNRLLAKIRVAADAERAK